MDLDAKILELRSEGASLRDIGKQLGISHVAVKKRLDKQAVNQEDQKLVEDGKLNLDLCPKTKQALDRLDKALNLTVETLVKETKGQIDTGRLVFRTGDGWRIEKKD